MRTERKHDWPFKVNEISDSLRRSRSSELFSKTFYENLFFLNPKLKDYFKETDWDHQHIALLKGIDHLLGFFDKNDRIHHQNLSRISESHSKINLNIHPHSYYYWIDAMVMTVKELDQNWYNDLEYYLRECLFFPISFIISNYHRN